MPSWLKGRRSSNKEAAEKAGETAAQGGGNTDTHAHDDTKPKREWDYKKQGADWEHVLACGLSCKRQSPIEIDSAAFERLIEKCKKGDITAEETTSTGNIMKLANADLLLTNNLASSAPTKKDNVVFDCGYKLQLKPHEDGSFGFLERGETNKHKYNVVQFHFHAPSEHTQSNNRAPLELHIVCKCVESGKEDDLLVLGIFFDKHKDGKECCFLKGCEGALVTSIKDKKTNFSTAVSAALEKAEKDINDKEPSLDLKGLLNDDATLIAYEGSLTTPPCTENVHWYVLKEPVGAAEEQLKRFGEYLKPEGSEGNFRLRQNVEVKANEQPLFVLAPNLPPRAPAAAAEGGAPAAGEGGAPAADEGEAPPPAASEEAAKEE